MNIMTDFRPQSWDEIVGQDHVISILKSSVLNGTVHNAYLFHGIRGTGKTTTARILAKALNCSNREDENPCLQCNSCIAIASGSSLDVKEIDMASNRGIDNVREIQEVIKYAPLGGKKKVLILDEAHQMTGPAASALLKSLEEPPEGVIWVLCTTEPDKIIATIRSRCQSHAFRRVPVEIISDRLRTIVGSVIALDALEEEQVEEISELCDAISLDSDGSVRDAENRLSNLVSANDLTLERYHQIFGALGNKTLEEIWNLCISGDVLEASKRIKILEEKITDAPRWVLGLANFVFNQMLNDEKNYEAYEPYLDVLDSYMRAIYTNQPVYYLNILIFKLAMIGKGQ